MASQWKIKNSNRKHISFCDDTEKTWTSPFYFIQGSDCQLGMIERYVKQSSDPCWEEEKKLTKLAVDKINALNPRPRFFVICGDLCDAFPSREPELRSRQEIDLKDILSKLHPDIPLVCVCGNHDVGDQPTKKDLKMYNSSFGDDYYSFWCGGVLCLVVNSQFWVESSNVPEEAAAQDAWLESQLNLLAEVRKTNAQSFAFIFQHVPWFLNTPDEPANQYFTIKPDVRNIWLPKFKAAGVKTIFCGHYHRNAGGWFQDMEVITTSAIGAQLGDDQSGLRVVKVNLSEVTHEYFSFETFPSEVKF